MNRIKTNHTNQRNQKNKNICKIHFFSTNQKNNKTVCKYIIILLFCFVTKFLYEIYKLSKTYS